MSIEEDANQDLALSDEDAESVAGGKVQSTKHSAARTEPLMIRQEKTFGATEVSANSGDDDCAPEFGGGSD